MRDGAEEQTRVAGLSISQSFEPTQSTEHSAQCTVYSVQGQPASSLASLVASSVASSVTGSVAGWPANELRVKLAARQRSSEADCWRACVCVTHFACSLVSRSLAAGGRKKMTVEA